MSQRSTGPAGPTAGEDWPDDLWPAEDDAAGQHGDAAAGDGSRASAAPPLPSGWPAGSPRIRLLRPAVMAAVIIVAAAAGAGVAAAVVHDLSSPASGAGAGGGPPAANPGQPGGGTLPGGELPGGAGPAGGVGPGGGAGSARTMFVIGTVTAVSGTSITIGGPGHKVTATVTGATRVTGKVAGIGGIRVGDQVSAQLTQGSGRTIAVAIADPAQPPAGGSLP
jgi:hypothetical protein